MEKNHDAPDDGLTPEQRAERERVSLAAAAMGRKRWEGKSHEERAAHGRMIVNKRWAKRGKKAEPGS